MARYVDKDGKLVPVGKDGKQKPGVAFRAPDPAIYRDPFIETPKGPVICPACHKQFPNVDVAINHECIPPAPAEIGSEGVDAPVGGGAGVADTPPSPAVLEIGRELAAAIVRPCGHCGKALRGRKNQKYCNAACRVAAARARVKAKAKAKGDKRAKGKQR